MFKCHLFICTGTKGHWNEVRFIFFLFYMPFTLMSCSDIEREHFAILAEKAWTEFQASNSAFGKES